MSATSPQSQPISEGSPDALPPLPAAEVDASCGAPLLLLFLSAAAWLVAGSVLGLLASLKFHAPTMLAGHAWTTYGRIHPAQTNAFIYGFAVQAALGVTVWILAHLGRTRLAMIPAILAGGALWNLGVTVGIVGILYGDNTGYEWLEMPQYAAMMLFIGYLAMGLAVLTTFHFRRERGLYTSHWFLLAGVFWFPWIYSTATRLLVARPVRGALQAALDWWYMNNLSRVFFGAIGIGTIFYFIPKMTKRPLYSHGLGMFAFWGIVIFGSWGGILPGTPLPSWMPALSTVAAVLVVIPVLAVGMNFWRTGSGDCSAVRDKAEFRFICFGTMAFVVGTLVLAAASLRRVNKFTNFTWFVSAEQQWMLYGFFAMTMFGAIYYIVPRITGVGICERRMGLNFWAAAVGIAIYALALAVGGIEEGLALDERSQTFTEIMEKSLMPLRISAMGDLLMLLANVVLLLNLLLVLKGLFGSAVAPLLNEAKTAEVAS
jgi:cytochrome c oxidase cbb3-type subunit I